MMSSSFTSTLTRAIGVLVCISAAVVLINPVEGQPPVNLVDILVAAGATSTLDNSEPSIAVNPANPLQVAVVAFSDNWNPTTNAPVWKSDDGGNTWRKVLQIPQPASGFCFGPADQKNAFNAAGMLFVAELGVCPSVDDHVYRQTGTPDAPLTPGVRYGDDQPHLAIDTTQTSPCFNTLYSPWLDFGVAPVRSMVSNSMNGGATTMTDVTVGNNTFPNRTTRIAVASDGAVYVIFKTREGAAGIAGFENAHFLVKRSDDCGATWAAIGANGVPASGATAVQTFFTNCFGDPTFNCTNPPPMVGRARSSDAWIAMDPAGRGIFAAYISRDGSGFGQIYVAKSTDRGVTWASTRVTDGTHHSAYPEIAVADNGTVGVLYIDFVPPTPPCPSTPPCTTPSTFRHHFAQSVDGGITWTDQILQSMDPSAFANAASGFIWGDYEGLTALGNTFYGVFSGQSIGRTPPQLDPIFFKVTLEITVAIAIKPGSSLPVPINTRSRGLIPVAILSSSTFDAPAVVDRTSVTFGRTGDERSLAFCNASGEDVNGDGLLDLVCHFFSDKTGFLPGDTVGVLKGKTVNGTPFRGIESVRIIH